MPKALAFTMLTPVVLVTVICTAISFRLMPSGLWRIGPVIGVNWNGGAKARVDPVTVGYQSLLDISLAIGCLKKASSQAMT
jgi:hypothetical protein